MSGKLVGEIFRCAPADLTAAERLVLLCLAEYAPDRDRTARIPAAMIAERCCLKLGTVRNALATLAARCLVVPLHKASKGHSQDYRLTPLSEHHRASTKSPTLELYVNPTDPEASPHSDAKPSLSVIPQ